MRLVLINNCTETVQYLLSTGRVDPLQRGDFNEFLSKFANLARNAPKVLEMQSECFK